MVSEDRVISLGPGLAEIPERLLLAHARGEVLFISGAGVSKSAGLPDFRELVISVYAELDTAVHAVISAIPFNACNRWSGGFSGLRADQAAEVKRFVVGDYDVVLGMLERRIDTEAHGGSRVRKVIVSVLRGAVTPAPIHRALLRLADRGVATSIVTTNFDLLFEASARRVRPALQTYTLGGIPRPTTRRDFNGIFHIHGALDSNAKRISDLVVSDRDFGEFYLRRRVVPDFIYDAARLFCLVLVGYSANDPPMRYLLNAVAADGTRFGDLKERFAFVGTGNPDPIGMQDWKGRGITPIRYDDVDSHVALCRTLERWAGLSAINGKSTAIDAEIKRIVRAGPRSTSTDGDRDLLDHLIRRSSPNERIRLSALISGQKADIDWLSAITAVSKGGDRRPY